MNSGISIFMLSLLLVLITISLISALDVVNFTNPLFVNALESEAKTTGLAIENVKYSQQEKVIEASGHFANNQIQNGSVTWIQGGL